MMKSLNVLTALFIISITGCSPAEDASATKPPATEITQQEAEVLKNANNIIQDSRVGVTPGIPAEKVHADLAEKARKKGADYFVVKKDDNGNIIAADLYKK